MPTIHVLPTVAHLWFLLIVLAVLEGIAVYTWRYRKEPGALSLIQLETSKGVWLLALYLAGISADHWLILVYVNIARMAALLSCLLWLRFVSQLCEADREISERFWQALYGAVGVVCIVVLTNSWHGWLWQVTRTPDAGVRISDGPALKYYVLTAYFLYLLGTGLCVRWAFRSDGLRRRQAFLISFASLLPAAGQILASATAYSKWDPMPACFLASSSMMAWTYFRWCIITIVPLAQQSVAKNMIDGLLVVDQAGYIVEMNARAQSLWGEPTVAKGRKFEEAVKVWPDLGRLRVEEGTSTLEASRTVGESARHFEITLTLLRAPAGYPIGRILVFRDITNEKQQQARIVEQEKAITLFTERERLGRELHDDPSQLWSFLSMQIHAVRLSIGKQRYEQAIQMLDRLQCAVQEVHIGLRESIAGLQTNISDGRGLLAALEKQLDWYRENCDLNAELIVRCAWREGMQPPQVEAQILRIIQEALSNVRKSANASNVQIRIEEQDRGLTFLVEDDGCGFDPSCMAQRTGHHGLQIMRERAQEIGAQFLVDSSPGEGTRIVLRLPLSRSEREEVATGSSTRTDRGMES